MTVPTAIDPQEASSPSGIARACFPGGRSENAERLGAGMQTVLDHWFAWRERRIADGEPKAVARAAPEPAAGAEHDRLRERLEALCEALTAETPTFTPRYLAHMKADLSLPGLLGWFAAMLHNPNNSSPEASRVGGVIEAQAIARLAAMLGYDPARAQGHFTSGGTVANFEAVWRARYRMDHWLALGLHLAEARGEPLDLFRAAHMGWDHFRAQWKAHDLSDAVLKPCSAAAGNPADVHRRLSRAAGRDYLGPVMLVPGSSHYSWSKAANVFGLGGEAIWSVALDAMGRLDVDDLENKVLAAEGLGRPVLMVVGVAGATETGAVDPLDRLYDRMDLWEAERGWRIWRHVDAAYGGFFRAMLGGRAEAELAPETARALHALGRSDSVTIDPHKLGYVPYACGAFLSPDVDRYVVSAFDAPYLDRPELGAGKWSSTLEGSRSATGAAATWLTAESIGLGPDGLGALLAGTVEARKAFQAAIIEAVPQARFLPAETNILCFSIAEDGERLSRSNARTAAVFDHFHRSPAFSVSRTVFGPDNAAMKTAHLARYGGIDDDERLTVMRCVVMNPYWCEPDVRGRLTPMFVAELRAALDGGAAGRPPEGAA